MELTDRIVSSHAYPYLCRTQTAFSAIKSVFEWYIASEVHLIVQVDDGKRHRSVPGRKMLSPNNRNVVPGGAGVPFCLIRLSIDPNVILLISSSL